MVDWNCCLIEKTDPFHISRASSDLITFSWHYRLSNVELTEQQIKEAKETIEEMEKIHKNKLKKFELKTRPISRKG